MLPPTRLSVVGRLGSADDDERRVAFDALVGAYWKPVYKYLRLRWRASPDEAQDLTQEFFARALEKGFFARYDPAVARFRTYLRTCLDGFAANERKAASRLKRGGDAPHLPLDFQTAEGEVRPMALAADVDLDAFFHQEWVRALCGAAVEALRAEYRAAGRDVPLALFEQYDLADDPAARPTYRDLADAHGLAVHDVTNRLAAARRDFRRLVLDRLREICASEDEYEAEARALLGARAG